jgi:hypothetical protein
MDLIWVCRVGKCFFGRDWTAELLICPWGCSFPPALNDPEAKSSAPELRFAFFHERAPSFAKILRVHAGDADLLDRFHVTLVGIL